MTENKVSTESNGKNTNDNLQDPSELEQDIIRQVEYYFGDQNLIRDKFMKEQIKLDEGWIPIDVLLTFNRLSKLTTDSDVIVSALNKSISGLLDISEDNKRIRRSPEMPLPEMNEELRKEILSRTVYVKGFPLDTNIDDLLKFFNQFEDLINVLMRKYLDRQTKERKFKGSVFVTFKDKEKAQKLVEKEGLKYQDKDLIVRWQEVYLQEKQAEYAARNKNKKQKSEKNEEKKDFKEELKLPTGSVIHFTGGNEKMSREHVKEALAVHGGEIAFIDYKIGDKEGWVRYSKENVGKEVFEKITDGKLKIEDSEVVFKLLEGEEETTYLEKTVENMKKRRKNHHNHNKNKRGNWQSKGKYQGGRKRKHGTHEDEPAQKVKAE